MVIKKFVSMVLFLVEQMFGKARCLAPFANNNI